MTHAEIRQKLLEWRDREPAEADRPAVEDHLGRCAECRRFRERWDRITQAFGRQPVPDAPEFFVEQVMRRVRQPNPAPARTPLREAWWWVPALAPGLALLLFVLAIGRTPVSSEALLEGGSGWSARMVSRPAVGDLLDLMVEG